MSRREHQQTPQPPPGRALLLSPERAAKLMALLDRLDLEPDPTQFDKYTRAGQVFFRLRPQEQTTGTGGGGGSSPLYASIVTLPDTDPVEYGVTVTTGFMEYQNAGASEAEDGAVGVLTPVMGGIPLGTPDIPPLPLPGLVSYTYLRLKTDSDGVPKFAKDAEFPGDPSASAGALTIETFSEPQTDVHHVRENPLSGEEEGDYFFLLLETESDGADPPAPRPVQRVSGNRFQPNQLVQNKNVGGERELYLGYKVGPDDWHEWRTLKQLVDGEDYEVGVIQELEDDEPEQDFIPFKGFGVKQTGEYPPRPARFEENLEKDANLLKFFGFDGDMDLSNGGVINFAGGLAVSFTSNPPEDATGWWGTVQWIFYDAIGSLPTFVNLTFENGLLKTVSQSDSGGAPEDVPGTQATPGSVAHTTYDTVP